MIEMNYMKGYMMSKYEEGLKLVEECCGNNKDNVIAVSTISIDTNEDGLPYSFIRDVDAYYEDGVFYITTWAKSNKMKQIDQNKHVGFSVNYEGITGHGIGENLGWVLDPSNSEIRLKLRNAFSDWYDDANNEKDKNCVIMAVRITKCNIFRDHGAVRYNLDLVNKKEI